MQEPSLLNPVPCAVYLQVRNLSRSLREGGSSGRSFLSLLTGCTARLRRLLVGQTCRTWLRLSNGRFSLPTRRFNASVVRRDLTSTLLKLGTHGSSRKG